jgi:hypothetical protein
MDAQHDGTGVTLRSTRLVRSSIHCSRLAVVLFAIVAGTVLAGCGAVGSPVRQPTEVALTKAEFAFVASSGLTRNQLVTVAKAEDALTSRCMAAKGFAFYPGTPAPRSPLGSSIDLESYSGQPPNRAADLAARRLYGYGLFGLFTPAGELAGQGGRNAEFDQYYYSHELTPRDQRRYQAALGGGNGSGIHTIETRYVDVSYTTGGCRAAAQAKVFGSTRAAAVTTSVGNSTNAFVLRAVNQTPAVQAATLLWSRCMLARVHLRFADPNAPVAYLMRLYTKYGPVQSLREQEVRLSLTDAACQFSSRLAYVYSHAFRLDAGRLPRGLQRVALSVVAADVRASGVARRVVASVRVPETAPIFPSSAGGLGSEGDSNNPVPNGKHLAPNVVRVG